MATIKLIETQSIGLHNVHEGLQSIIEQFQTWSAFCKFSTVMESSTAKEEDGLTPFLILDVLEATIFRYNVVEGHIVWANVRLSKCPSTHRHLVSAFWRQKQSFYETLVALATVSVAISSPESMYFIQELWQVSFVLNALNVGRSAVHVVANYLSCQFVKFEQVNQRSGENVWSSRRIWKPLLKTLI